MFEGKVSGGWSQALLGDAKRWNKRQWGDPDAQEVPLVSEEELYHAGDGGIMRT